MSDTSVPSETPSLYEISQLSRDFGLVGERDTHLVVFTTTISGGFVIMTGQSRSGKDAIVDGAEYVRPGGDIARISGSTSKTALYYNNDRLNNARIHRYPDIASLDDHIERVLKAHGEGRSITHEVTDVSGSEATTVERELTPPDSMILFLASDNEQVDLDDYPEVRNRALVVSTDATADLTKRVNTRQAEMRSGLYERRVDPDRADEIRAYVGSIPTDLYGANADSGAEVFNIPAVPIDNENPLPQLFPEARMDFPRLLDFIESITLYHYQDRMELPLTTRDATVSLLVTPADAWLGMKVFGEKMVLSALNLREHDFEALDLLRQRRDEGMSVADIQMELKTRGYNVTTRDVRDSLEGMLNKGYVYKDAQSSPVLYTVTPFASPDNVNRDVNMDWQQIVDDTKEVAREVLPADDADEYIARFCEGAGLEVVHPFEGAVVDITDTDTVVDEIQDRQDQEASILDRDLTPPPDDDNGVQDDVSPGDNTQLHGTFE